MTTEQSVMLAAIEQAHGRVKRIPDDSNLGEQLLARCLTNTRAYFCGDCATIFAIEPDGETEIYACVSGPRS